jgi:cytidylate kinase
MDDNKKNIVTIDGPSGSGKSTISKLVADRLGYTFLDTGAMYRAVGYKAKQEGVDLEDSESLSRILDTMELTLLPGKGDTKVILDKKDVSNDIRTAEMGLVASKVSALAVVRQKLTQLQQQMGERGQIVAEGRDTGTVVFPDAQFKFYLDAAPEERARRRYLQLLEKGMEADQQEILSQILKRDQDDSSRALAPLKAADDATIIDSSSLSIEDVVNCILEKISASLANSSK